MTINDKLEGSGMADADAIVIVRELLWKSLGSNVLSKKNVFMPGTNSTSKRCPIVVDGSTPIGRRRVTSKRANNRSDVTMTLLESSVLSPWISVSLGCISSEGVARKPSASLELVPKQAVQTPLRVELAVLGGIEFEQVKSVAEVAIPADALRTEIDS